MTEPFINDALGVDTDIEGSAASVTRQEYSLPVYWATLHDLRDLALRIAALEAGSLAHSAEHRELDATLSCILAAVPQSAAAGPVCGFCGGPATRACTRCSKAPTLLCPPCAEDHVRYCGPLMPLPLAPDVPQPEANPAEQGEWLPGPDCHNCGPEFAGLTFECSRCTKFFCRTCRFTHAGECWV